MPALSTPERRAAPSLTPSATDLAAAESLRALKQKDSIRLVPRPTETSLPTPAPAPAGQTSAQVHANKDSLSSDGSTTVPVRRKARMTDFARVLLPSEAPAKTESPTPPPSEATPAAVVPAAFPVAGTAGSVLETKPEPSPSNGPSVSSFDKTPSAPRLESEAVSATPPISENASQTPSPTLEPKEKEPLTETTHLPPRESIVAPPKDRPASESIEPAKPPPDPREKREFILANGERILGHILSETADTLYLDHPTLGVLTLPRTQIATKPIEVILINGDRIVGDLIAETSECLYIRHASLGMLTVPHGQRSTRVVEAILKDGDRILGEVLAETDHFTVIRSATLGTVAVQHEQVAMLNRKIEQMQLRTLPSAPALENTKPKATS